MTVRRLLSFIRGLPENARVWKKLTEPMGEYDKKEYLLLNIIDLLSMTAYYSFVSTMVNIPGRGDKNRVISKAPKPLPRPEPPQTEKKKRKFNSVADLAKALGRKVQVNT